MIIIVIRKVHVINGRLQMFLDMTKHKDEVTEQKEGEVKVQNQEVEEELIKHNLEKAVTEEQNDEQKEVTTIATGLEDWDTESSAVNSGID